jgi:hypothetical protein
MPDPMAARGARSAIRIEEGGRFELVLLKKNVLTLEDAADYTMVADYSDVYSGFVNSFGVMEAWLLDEITAFEAPTPKGSLMLRCGS